MTRCGVLDYVYSARNLDNPLITRVGQYRIRCSTNSRYKPAKNRVNCPTWAGPWGRSSRWYLGTQFSEWYVSATHNHAAQRQTVSLDHLHFCNRGKYRRIEDRTWVSLKKTVWPSLELTYTTNSANHRHTEGAFLSRMVSRIKILTCVRIFHRSLLEPTH